MMKRGVFEREKDVPRDVSVKCPNPQQWGRHGGVKSLFNEAVMPIRFSFLEMYVKCLALRMQDRLLSGTRMALQKER